MAAERNTEKAKTAVRAKRKGKERADSHSTRSQPPKKARIETEDVIDESECCVCFVTYEEDILHQSRKDWVGCACGRWLHEDCAEDCVLDSSAWRGAIVSIIS